MTGLVNSQILPNFDNELDSYADLGFMIDTYGE